MNLDLQFKIRNDENMLSYLRQHSNWYKYLNRNPQNINDFIKEMREVYKLRPTDKFNSFVEKLDLISSFIDVLK